MNSVLIIDDDKELCTLMKKCVEQENLSAVVAHGGLEGLRLLEENKDTCSLIILDVMMPDMNGFQVLQEIRKKNNVPVLMLTAKSDEEDKVSGLRLGADDYLTKPFGINELMARVNSLIRRYTTLNPVAGSEAATMLLKDMVIDPHYRHDEFVDVTDEVWAAMYQAQREMENYERRKVYHRAYYSLDAYSWLENYALEHSRSPEDILLEREEMTTRLHLIAALPAALAHATPTQARRVHAYYIAGIKQPEISRREGVHSSKVSVAIRRGLRNMRRCYDGLFQTE